ncbi:hypothetical protein MF672_045245 [Actinomadura sp. ATCC 31491]|uniref:Uncharacterized protein n=1 Tax=Actinomadura luzonensis TaxID=2805427 RepID=A0ABT0GA57_9ACTN|nr:hypothetical protein [Actinomadura luzonensis]MCK2220966.1 hypothetical protein [Actinomadura luzonensis]
MTYPPQPPPYPQPRQGGPPGLPERRGPYDPPASYGPTGYDRPASYNPPAHDPTASYGAPVHDPTVPYDAPPARLPQYGLPPAPYEPPRRNTALVVGLSVGLGALLLGGGAYGAIRAASARPSLSLPGNAASRPAAAPTTVPWASDPPSDQPNDQPSDEPDDQPSGQPSGRPSPQPRGTTHAVPGSPITNTEFGDWAFAAGRVRFAADRKGGWTYDTCEPVDAQGVLAKNDCERATQVAYSAYRGHLKAVQVVMAFPTDKAAKTAETRLLKLTSDGVNIRRDMVQAAYAYGRVRTNAIKKYLIVTVVTADRTARAKASKFHLYLQADALRYFLLRDVTITS